MGRPTTGAITINSALTLKIQELKNKGLFSMKGCSGTIKWAGGAEMGFKYFNSDGLCRIELYYTHTDHSGNKQDINSVIQICSIPSNLGIGEILYFVCPNTYKHCKTLYMAYGSPYFKHREAYSIRIYYRTQIRSKNDRFNYRYWDLAYKLELMEAKSYKCSYKGKQTQISKQVILLRHLKNEYNHRRIIALGQRIGFKF